MRLFQFVIRTYQEITLVLITGEAGGWGWVGRWIEGFHAPSGHGEGHYQIGVGDLRVVYIRIDMDCGLAGLAAAGVAQAFELRG